MAITRSEFVKSINNYIHRIDMGTGDVRITSNASMRFCPLIHIELVHVIYKRLNDNPISECVVWINQNSYPLGSVEELELLLSRIEETITKSVAAPRIMAERIESYYK